MRKTCSFCAVKMGSLDQILMNLSEFSVVVEFRGPELRPDPCFWAKNKGGSCMKIAKQSRIYMSTTKLLTPKCTLFEAIK